MNSRTQEARHDEKPLREAVWKQDRLAATLALIAGYVDAYAFLNYKIYASFMSGNTTQTGLQTGLGKLLAAGHNLLPIPAFAVGVFAGALVFHARWRQPHRALFGAVAALLAASFAAAVLAWPGWCAIVLLSLAMGAMNTTVSRVGAEPVSLGYVTGCLSNLAQHLALAIKRLPVPNSQGAWDTHGRRALLLGSIWAGFLLGALLGGAATPRLTMWTLLPPVLILATLAVTANSHGESPR